MQNATVTLLLDKSLQLKAVYAPFLLAVEPLSNILCAVVFFRYAPATSTNVYMSALSLADFTFATTGLIWHMRTGQTKDQADLRVTLGCAIPTFLHIPPGQVSEWMVLAVTIDRALAIYAPIKSKSVRTTRVAKYVVIGVVVLAMAWGIPLLLLVPGDESDPNRFHRCRGRNEHLTQYAWNIYPWYDLAMYACIPSVVVCICTTMILFKLIKEKRYFRYRRGAKSTLAKLSQGTTIMLISVATLCLICTLPVCILVITLSIPSVAEDKETFAKVNLAMTVAEMFMFLNHSVNLYVCLASNAHFRQYVRKALRMKSAPADGVGRQTVALMKKRTSVNFSRSTTLQKF